MQKISSLDKKLANDARNKKMMSFFMLLIMIGSVVGFGFAYYSGSSNSNSGNNSNDEDNSDLTGWPFEFNGQTMYLSNSQESVANIQVKSSKSIADYAGKVIYLDSDSSLVANEIKSTLGLYSSRIQPACFGSCEKNLPELNCSDNLIVWNSSKIDNIYQEDECVFIEGDIKTLDAFIYHTFGA